MPLLGEPKTSRQKHRVNLEDWALDRQSMMEDMISAGLKSNDSLQNLILRLDSIFTPANNGYYDPSLEAARQSACTFQKKLVELHTTLQQDSMSPRLKTLIRAYYDLCVKSLKESSRLSGLRERELSVKQKPAKTSTVKLMQAQKPPLKEVSVSTKVVDSREVAKKTLSHVKTKVGAGRISAPAGGISVFNGHTDSVHQELTTRSMCK